MAGDSPIDAGGRGGHVPWERIEATLMAGALTARPRTDDDRFPTLTPTEDVPARLDQARAMLTRLDAYQRSLPSPSAAGEHERRLLDAIDAGDDDTMARLGLDAEYG